MSTPRRAGALLAGVWVIWGCLGATSALAQDKGQEKEPKTPFRGLFGAREVISSSRSRTMDIHVNTYGGYDDNVIAGQGGSAGSVDPRRQVSGNYAGLDLGVAYTNRSGGRTLGLSAGGAARYYGKPQDFTSYDYHAGIGFTTGVGRRSSLTLDQDVTFAPYYFDGAVLPRLAEPEVGEPTVPDRDHSITDRTVLGYRTSVGFSHQLGRHLSMGVNYNFGYTDFQNDELDLKNHAIGVDLSRPVSRYVSLNVQYGYQLGYFQLEGRELPIHSHGVDVGLSQAVLPFSRRTSLNFGAGATAVLADDLFNTISVPDDPDTSDSEELATGNHYQISGYAGLRHSLGRAWGIRGEFRRAVQYVQGFRVPVFTNSVNANIGGPINRRVSVSASTSYSIGDVGFVGVGRGYDTYSASTSVQFAMTRHLALSSSYSFFHYKFEEDVLLPLNFSSGLDRHGVRVGLNVWIPVLP